jgi:alpha-aminoadipate carrier protein LysW
VSRFDDVAAIPRGGIAKRRRPDKIGTGSAASTSNRDTTVCPECRTAIDVEDDVEEGQTLDCPECGAELQVVNTDPVELEVSSSEEEEEEAW